MSNKRNSSILQIFQISASVLVNLIIGIITTPIITRLVQPTEYGKLSMFNTYSAIALMIFTLGLDQTLVRYFFINDNFLYKKKLFKLTFIIPIKFASLSFFLITILIILIQNVITINKVYFILLVINIYVLIINRFGMLLLRLQYKTNIYSTLNILHKLIYVLILIPLLLTSKEYHLFILILATISSIAITSTICIYFERQFWFSKIEISNLNINKDELLKYGIPLMISSSIFLIFQATDRLCIKYLCNYNDVGIYSSAQSLTTIFSIIQTTFNILWAPKSIEYYEKNKNVDSYYKQVNHIITVIMFSFGSIILIFKDLIVLLLGEKYREASSIIPFLLFNPIMYTVSETTVSGLNITKKTKYQVYITIISCLANLIGNLILIPQLGLKGAAVSTGISYILFYTLRTVFSNHFYKIKYNQLRFYFLTLIFVCNCIYNMYFNFSIISIILFITIIITTILLYYDAVKIIISYVIQILSRKKR